MDNKTPRPSSAQSLRLPQELIEEEILSRLPVKSLLRFKCVSKSWRSLIGSKRFIKTHLQNYTNSLTYDDDWRAILHCYEHGLNRYGPNNSYWDEPFLELTPFDDPKNNHLMAGVVVGSASGLLCVYKEDECRFFVWNPETRVSVEIPKIDIRNPRIIKWGFGCDGEGSGAYKLFVVVSKRKQNKRMGKLYSSKANSWKTVDELAGVSPLRAPACVVDEKFHWLTDSLHIELFDLKSEVFGMMELPFKPEAGDRVQLKELEGCFCVVCRNDNDETKRRIWCMEEYGVKETWVEEVVEEISEGEYKKTKSCCLAYFYPESLVSPVPDKD